jgi:hypothetical protein
MKKIILILYIFGLINLHAEYAVLDGECKFLDLNALKAEIQSDGLKVEEKYYSLGLSAIQINNKLLALADSLNNCQLLLTKSLYVVDYNNNKCVHADDISIFSLINLGARIESVKEGIYVSYSKDGGMSFITKDINLCNNILNISKK